MIGADNVLAQGDGGTIKHGQLPLRQENVGAMSEQGGMRKCRKCQSNGGARWDGKMSEMSEQDGMGKCQKCQSKVGARWERKWYMTSFRIDPDLLELTGCEVSTLNEQLKKVFGRNVQTTGDGIVPITEHGDAVLPCMGSLQNFGNVIQRTVSFINGYLMY